MNALFPVFLAVLLGEIGSKSQGLGRSYGRQGNHLPVIGALLIASVLSYGLGAAAGLYMGRLLAEEARLLLAGLALAMAGAPMLWPRKPAVEVARPARFMGMIMRFIIAQFGDGAQFVVFAFAAYAMSPGLALAGGLLGVIAGTLAILSADRMGMRLGAATATRIGAGALLLLAGGWLAVTALGIG
jgi:Ca2+/H+ antiporter, TMEM165/GDT1 family